MATDAAVLLVTDVAALPARVVLWAVRTFEDKLGPGKDVAVITQASGQPPCFSQPLYSPVSVWKSGQRQLGSLGWCCVNAGVELKVAPLSADVFISLAETPGYHSASRLNEIVKVLRPGGTLLVQEPLARRAASTAESQVGYFHH